MTKKGSGQMTKQVHCVFVILSPLALAMTIFTCIYRVYIHSGFVCFLYLQDILRLLFGKDAKDVDVDMVMKKRNELMADRGKKVQFVMFVILVYRYLYMCIHCIYTCTYRRTGFKCVV